MKIICQSCNGSGRNMRVHGTTNGCSAGVVTVCKPCKGLGRIVWRNTMK